MANSGFPGVYYAGPGKYRSRYRSDGKTIHLGTFDTAEKAHAAYKNAKSRKPFKVGDKVLYQDCPEVFSIEEEYAIGGVFRIGNKTSFVDLVTPKVIRHI